MHFVYFLIFDNSVLSTTSIYIDRNCQPVLVDLSSARYVSHRDMDERLKKELKNKSRNLGKDNVVASQKAGK